MNFLPQLATTSLAAGRYSVDNIPLYDSGEDDPSLKLPKPPAGGGAAEYGVGGSLAAPMAVEPLNSMRMSSGGGEAAAEQTMYSPEAHHQFAQNAMISRIQSNASCRKYHIEPGPSKFPRLANGKTKTLVKKQLNVKLLAESFASAEASQELLALEVLSTAILGFCSPPVEEERGGR